MSDSVDPLAKPGKAGGYVTCIEETAVREGHEYMSTDGRARSGKNMYCIRCRMHLSLCLCADIQPIDTRTQVAIILHETEQSRTSNTGYLATLMLSNAVLRIHGERGRSLDVHDWFEPTHRTFVLFPHAEARILDRRLAEEDVRPIRLIVPDGTWRQARRMVRRVDGLAKAPTVTLPEGLVSEYRLRKGRPTGGMCTFEAISEALCLLEGPQLYAPLDHVLSRFVERLLWRRGLLSAEKVTGGIPKSAFQFRNDISRGIPAGSFCVVRKGCAPEPRAPEDRPEPPRQRDD
jgi:DTW domain-containing protein